MALYAWGFEKPKNSRWMRAISPVTVLLLSEWEISFTRIWIYPAALLLPMICLFGRSRTVAWAQTVTAGLLGSLLSWKAADAWPLLPGLTLLCAMLMLAPVLLLCRVGEDRGLACALGGLLYELFFCLREYMLFSFCVVRLGSREGLSLGALSVCLCLLLAESLPVFRKGGKSVLPTGN